MADCNPKKYVFMKLKWNLWLKLDYIPVLSVHLITGGLCGIIQDLYFKENQL